MDNIDWVYTIQRQPSIHPAGHRSNDGTNVPGMVSQGTLIYPTGGPASDPPEKTGTNCRYGTESISGMSTTVGTTK